jgi:hypothetical protein
MPLVFLIIATLGCAPKKPAPLPEDRTSAPAAQPRAKAVGVENLRELKCGLNGCTVWTPLGQRSLEPGTLALGALAPGTPPAEAEVILDEAPAPVDARWNQQIAAEWRSPFQEQVPTPTGGRVSYLRSMATGVARLVRFGGGMRAHPAPRAESPVAYRRWLALHPTGQQAYLAPWPHTEIIAIDPDQLLTGWRLELDAPTLGLFVDNTGRYLVGETGAEPTEDRMLDYSEAPIAVAEGVDPTGDPHIAKIPRPLGTHTIVVDLVSQVLVARLPGTYMRWVPQGESVLIATTQAVARLPLAPAP